MTYKQAILVRADLKLPKGKMAAQVAHAAVQAVANSSKDKVQAWEHAGQGKIVLKVEDLAELKLYEKRARDAGLTTALIMDAGHTVVEPGTITCLGIGPDAEGKLDALLSKLKLA
ncbi:MAG TPA: peptidyl-tRNA hydrolase Pth2 [Candidatus Nanoarchaeia archaeon]|nr:peptidyl-tRNA hydrolase Pth2 [Candidatus Nanoarchaeia archaeon]